MSILSSLARLFSMSASNEIVRVLDLTLANEVTVDRMVIEAASILRSGGVIALPTDTVYGIACLVDSSEAISKLYDIKERNLKNPIAICVAEVEDMEKWANITVPSLLLKKLFPGQVTAIFTRRDRLNPLLNPDSNLVGLRVPDFHFIRQLVRSCQCPIALTSANKSGHQSTLKIEEFRELWPSLDVIIDGGEIKNQEPPSCRKGSTVVDLSREGYFKVLRQGSSYEKVVKTLTSYNLKVQDFD